MDFTTLNWLIGAIVAVFGISGIIVLFGHVTDSKTDQHFRMKGYRADKAQYEKRKAEVAEERRLNPDSEVTNPHKPPKPINKRLLGIWAGVAFIVFIVLVTVLQ